MVHVIRSAASPSARARSSSNRRQFLGRIGGVTAVAATASVIDLPALAPFGVNTAHAAAVDPTSDQRRRNQAYRLRHKAALYQRNLPLPEHSTNGDDELYRNRIGSYSKALPHNQLGEVDPAAYTALLAALVSGDPNDFERIPLGGVIKQTSPQAAFAFELEGADSHHLGIPAPPAFGSAETASEMAEVYWQAVTRDVPFAEYDAHPLTLAAAADLTRFSEFHGPKADNQVTPATLFRGTTPGDLVGPYISQFLWQEVPYNATPIVQRLRTAAPGVDYMTAYAEWLAIQNGAAAQPLQFDSTQRYIRNGRDLAEYDHRDFTYQHFLNACLILLGFGSAAVDPNNPYKQSLNQSGFSTFGAPHILGLVAYVANCALKAAWYQKWSMHRRLRPEAMGGRIHNHRTSAANYPINPEILNSPVLDEVFSRHGTYLLPMAYPEGSPTHPAYPAGHAAIAGACTTVLKAFFDESFVIRDPVAASADGLSLVPYTGAALTVGDELDKLATNIAIGRDTAGVHWRSDGIEGLKLGEAVAVSILTDTRGCFNERFDGFTLTKFDGSTTTV